MTQAGEKMEFKTELKQLLDIIVHSLYSEREIFLRELISNACDAIDKVRFEALTDESLREGDEDYRITLQADDEAGTLTLTDNGIGMNRERVISDLGTIARSGTKAFMEQLKEAKSENKPELIGQFGVGFYSAFMVADQVTVITRAAGESADEAVKWVSDGQGEFEIESTTKASRGTQIILRLRDDCKEYLERFRIQSIVKKYSDFVEHPIVLLYSEEETEGEGDEATTKTVHKQETINSQKALWLRSPSDVTEEEYAEFYKQVGSDFREPADTLHFSIEGLMEYKALVFIPQEKPFDLEWKEAKSALQLYIHRVFITDKCEALLPGYLRFVKGVVETNELPLNVSRELLQESAVLNKISKSLTSRTLKALAKMKKTEEEKYKKFYDGLGVVLKEGVHSDHENKEKIAGLLIFDSTKTEEGKTVDLDTYIENMPEGQDSIYYLIGESKAQIAASPYLEVFNEKGQEVLLLTDPIDEFIIDALSEYKGKKLVAVDRGEIPEDEDAKKAKEENEKELAGVLGKVKEILGESVKDVRLSTRLKNSAACLVADDGEMSAHMERLMKRMGQGAQMPATKRILELNADSDAVKALQKIYDGNADDVRIGVYSQLLFDQATIAEGGKPLDPAAMAERMSQLMVQAAE